VQLSEPASRPITALLEREQPLRQVAALVHAAREGKGAIVAILGAPGEGKTALLEESCRIAGAAGMAVCRARCSELEQAFALGVARQLLEPPVRALDPQLRAGLLDGPAGLAASPLDIDAARPGERSLATLHGLYWLAAGLAEGQPLLLAIDDAHWADVATLQWLGYLARRIAGLPLLVAIATRPLAPDAREGPLVDLMDERLLTLLRIGALSEEAVATLAEGVLGQSPHARFAAELHRVTGGNPFSVNEVLGELARAGATPSVELAKGLQGRAPEALQRDVRRRIARLGEPASAAARALAILGERATAREVALLGELDPNAAADALDALALEGVLSAGAPLAFAHPLLRAAVYDALPARRRARLHARAAALLIEDGASAETVAAQLLRSDPEGNAASVKSLRAAAADAMRRGAPQQALAHLTRALAEPPSARERAQLLAELAGAEMLLRSPAAIGHLREAVEQGADPVERARLRWLLSDALFFANEWDAALAQLELALEELGERDLDLALRLEGRLLTFATLDARAVLAGRARPARSAEDEHVEHLQRRAEAAAGVAGARPARLNLALLLAVRARPVAEIEALIDGGLDHGRFLECESSEAIEATYGAFALVLIDDLSAALRHTDAMLADAAARGSVLGFLAGSTFRALANLRGGALAQAEADAAPALELALEHGLNFTIPFTAAYLALILLERGRAAEAAELLVPIAIGPELAGTPAGVTLLEARARVRQACGEPAPAVEDLRACGEACELLGVLNPNVVAWRSQLALALRTEAPLQARELVARELALARAAGVARGVGVALRASAALATGEERERLLGESVAALASCPARLELAGALIDLGAHLRREGRRASAREPLRRGLEMAHEARAEPLAERAREELLASGARPRRPWLTGVDALTPSELRVARLAAAGASNPEIAQALFVTTQTVKGHLSNVYRKLAISARAELADALASRSEG
jgi:DNA-binding CsgD family transcriptional regulator